MWAGVDRISEGDSCVQSYCDVCVQLMRPLYTNDTKSNTQHDLPYSTSIPVQYQLFHIIPGTVLNFRLKPIPVQLQATHNSHFDKQFFPLLSERIDCIVTVLADVAPCTNRCECRRRARLSNGLSGLQPMGP